MEFTQINILKPKTNEPKKVCAYARVSSGKDAMLHSLSAQISYYSEYIGKHKDWEYKGVFAEMKIAKVIQFENMNPRQKARNKGF